MVWRHLTKYLQCWVPASSDVLELGAGWCDFSNQVSANHIVAMDQDETALRSAAPHVTTVVGDCCDLSRFENSSFDVVFASNLLEHLERPQTEALLGEAHRVLRPGGRLILLQPNFRLNPRHYFDDYTHVAIFTDQSLHDLLVVNGFVIERMFARFLPLTLKSHAARLNFLVPWYLRSPIKPLAGQMLAVATRPGERR
ncbi:class I SAM-dependent methyltransferase [Leekyejoonella antrihumi]|uniref:Class I SAM-dependent methyltransferase n=1 Tax=Leekyejoonella antrihumi TaxID=1660198 RepID=A0A563DS04_9MICO|nr:class I SAM-dependent methyltransferase [Leekyejoonella antrihumi]